MNNQADYLKNLLKPDVVIHLGKVVGGPLDLFQLKRWLEESRTISEAGQSYTPRLISFRTETWDELNHLAGELQHQGNQITPAEIAALLVEASLSSILEGRQ